jgi:hypothetical protein
MTNSRTYVVNLNQFDAPSGDVIFRDLKLKDSEMYNMFELSVTDFIIINNTPDTGEYLFLLKSDTLVDPSQLEADGTCILAAIKNTLVSSYTSKRSLKINFLNNAKHKFYLTFAGNGLIAPFSHFAWCATLIIKASK